MITIGEYKIIADNIGESVTSSRGIVDNLDFMRNTLIDSDIPSGNFALIQLDGVIDLTYVIMLQDHVDTTKEIIFFINALQTHVITHHGSVDEFLSSNNVKVSQEFADLSVEVGYPIDADNIE